MKSSGSGSGSGERVGRESDEVPPAGAEEATAAAIFDVGRESGKLGRRVRPEP